MKKTMTNFNKIHKRTNTNSLKWDLTENELPMWVADMDFQTAPPIQKTIKEKAEFGIYGYTIIPNQYYQAYINWWKENYQIQMKKENLIYSIGVMPSISSIIRTLTQKNDQILIQTPVYNVFFNVIEKNKRKIIENPLDYKNGKYNINFKDLEEKLSHEKTKLMLLCNPHNPIGKIWNKEELIKIKELTQKHNVTVISDEIHCDLTDPQKQYLPYASIDDDAITCIAPTKTFNIAGIQSSIIHTKKYKKQIQEQIYIDDSGQANYFAIDATIEAYTHGKPWLEQLKKYIYNNKQITKKYLEKEIPEIKLVASDATYLLWLDCSKLNITSEKLSKKLQKNQGLYLTPGAIFGKNGDQFLRMNIACPQETLKKGLKKLKEGIIKIQET